MIYYNQDEIHKILGQYFSPSGAPKHSLIIYFISRETGRRTCVSTVTGHTAEANICWIIIVFEIIACYYKAICSWCIFMEVMAFLVNPNY